MRKTSHDGGDSTSITSGVENETKKSAMKPKKSSLKRKAPNFSQESDDTVIEPLLQKDKDKSEPQSAKYFGKGKTDSLQNKESDNKAKTTANTGFCGTTESLLSFKDSETSKTTSGIAPLHNYMNTNIFQSHDVTKNNVTTKSQILVEIDSSKQSSYSPSPLIFTTAKIHTDAKTKQMEPVQVTPVPILSTIEVSISKGGITTNEKKISNGSSVITPVYTPMPISKGKEDKITISSYSKSISPTSNKDAFGKIVTDTHTTKISNNSALASSSIKITLPSMTPTSSNSFLTKSNSKDKEDSKDIKKEYTQNSQVQSKGSNFETTTKNNVNTLLPLNGKSTDITTLPKTSQSTTETQNIDTTIKGSSKTPSQNILHNPMKNAISSNKQLQRQKTPTEEPQQPKIEPNVECSENSSAKILTSSQAKVVGSISNKDAKLPISANSMQCITVTKSSVTTAATKSPIVATYTVPSNSTHSIKPSTAPTTSSIEKLISPTTAAIKMQSPNSNKSSAGFIVSPTITKSPTEKVVAPSTSIVADRSKEANSQIPNSKILSEKTGASTITQSPSVTTNASDYSQPLTSSTIKATNIKTPSVITSTKTNLASSVTCATMKSSQVTDSKASDSVSAKLPVATTSISKTSLSSVTPTSITSQNNVSQENTIKQPTASVNTTPKTSTQSTTVNTSASASIKSPNNNSAQMFGTAKPSMISVCKPGTGSTVSKISPESSSKVNTSPSAKSPSSTSVETPHKKDFVASIKKPAATKTQSISTKSPNVSTGNKSTTSMTSKAPSSDVSPVIASAPKKSSRPVLTKTGSITTSAKSPAVSTSAKTPDVTSSSATTKSVKPTTSATQTNVNKSVGVAGSSVPSSTPVLRQTESQKKGGSRSNENNKDSKVSKA